MDVEVTIDDDGVPAVKVPALLDWLDSQIHTLEEAKTLSSEEAGIYLDNVIESYQNLKEEVTATAMETMDVCSAN
jgi:hypothetical protein